MLSRKFPPMAYLCIKFCFCSMDSKLKIISVNCRGLGNLQKRKDVLNYLSGKHADICCLLDTHFVPEIESFVKREWGGSCLFANKS